MRYIHWQMVQLGVLLFLLVLSCPLPTTGQIRVQVESGSIHPSNLTDTAIILQLLDDWQLVQRDLDSAKSLYEWCLEQSRINNFSYGITASLIALGYTYNVQGRYRAAISTYQQALIYSQFNTRNQQLLASIYTHIGQSYRALGASRTSAQFYLLAIQTIEAIPSSTLKLEAAYLDLTTVIEDPKLALHYLNKAYALTAPDNHHVRGIIYLNSAIQYNRLDEHNLHRTYIQKAYELGLKYHDSLLQFRALVKMASLSLIQDKPEEALSYITSAYRLKKDGDMEAFQENANQLLAGQIYFRLRQYERAAYYWQNVLKVAEDLSIKSQEAEALNNLSLLYATTNDFKQSLHHQLAYRALADSLMNRKIAHDLHKMEVEYRTAEKDKLIAQAQRETERKNFVMMLAIGGIAILSVSFITFYRHSRQRQKLLRQEKEIGQLKNVMKGEEKERRRIAQELHDGIGGLLGAIKMQASHARDHPNPDRFEKLMQLIDDTAHEVRLTSHNLLPAMLEKHTLEEALTLYCDNINRSTELRIEVQFHGTTADLDPSVTLVIYRIAQELIQNIIKHAQATIADVQITRNGHYLNIIVEDNGIGFDTQDTTTGIGLFNMKHRVQAMQGYISIDSVKGKSTTVFIEFDLKNLN